MVRQAEAVVQQAREARLPMTHLVRDRDGITSTLLLEVGHDVATTNLHKVTAARLPARRQWTALHMNDSDLQGF